MQAVFVLFLVLHTDIGLGGVADKFPVMIADADFYPYRVFTVAGFNGLQHRHRGAECLPHKAVRVCRIYQNPVIFNSRFTAAFNSSWGISS